METGATDRTAVYNAGLSTATKLIFDYTVQANDTALDLNYLATNSLSGTITDLNGNVSLKTLPALNSRNSLAGSKSLYVDAKQPTIINISSPTAAGTYNQRDIVYIKVYFDDKIKVVGKPKIKLNSSLTNFATYSSGSGSNALQFKYIVGVGDIANPLDFDSFQFVPGDSIKDYLGNYAVATYVGTGLSDKLIVINGSTKSAEIADAGITAIAEEKLNIVEGIGIYPNPAINGEVVMHFNGDSQNNKIEVNLFDVLGHKLVSEQIIGQNKAVIAKNLQPGIYIVSYVNGKQLFNQRILVK